LQKYYQGNWNFQVVKTGDSISTGQKTVKFLEVSMIHWPDSMFSYIPQEKLLLPNDGFGQQWACNERFDDEVDQAILYEETVKYYASILWPWSTVIKQKLDELELCLGMDLSKYGIDRDNIKEIIDNYHSQKAGATEA